MKRRNDSPLPALIGMALVTCVIATALGYPEIWLPVVAAIVVVLTMFQPRR